LIKNRYTLKITSKSELINIFEEIPKQNFEEGLFYRQQFYNFKLLNTNKVDYIKGKCQKVFRIPKLIYYEKINNQFLIGYDLETYKKVYIDQQSQLLVSSLDNRILNKFMSIFANDDNVFIIKPQEFNKKVNSFNQILFLKPGIKNQFYFISSIDVERDDEAIYIKDQKIIKIRYVNEKVYQCHN